MEFTHHILMEPDLYNTYKLTLESFGLSGNNLETLFAEHEKLVQTEKNRSGNLGIVTRSVTKIVTEFFVEGVPQ